jgi:uncharacterized membrane protein
LRWYDRAGNWIPTLEEEKLIARQEAQRANELAEQERQRADLQQQRAESAEQRAEQLVARLREMGIDETAYSVVISLIGSLANFS